MDEKTVIMSVEIKKCSKKGIHEGIKEMLYNIEKNKNSDPNISIIISLYSISFNFFKYLFICNFFKYTDKRSHYIG